MTSTAKAKVATAALLLAAIAASLVLLVAAALAHSGTSAPTAHTTAHHVRASRDRAAASPHSRHPQGGVRGCGLHRPAHEAQAHEPADHRVDQSRPQHSSRVFLAAFRGHKSAGSEHAVKRQIAHHLEPVMTGVVV
jgi:hypothetical protein